MNELIMDALIVGAVAGVNRRIDAILDRTNRVRALEAQRGLRPSAGHVEELLALVLSLGLGSRF